ncbi:hypothetical protein BJX65DRAFT_314414 [Aspergillus insuetus]
MHCNSLLCLVGARVDAWNNRSETPLHLTAEAQRFDTAEKLVKCGAPVSVVDQRGRTPVIAALDSFGAFFDSVAGRYEIGLDSYAGLPTLLEVLVDARPDILIRERRGAAALNVALSWHLKWLWLEKDAFESKEAKAPLPLKALKSKSKSWMSRDEQETRDAWGGRRAPRVKLPSVVHVT